MRELRYQGVDLVPVEFPLEELGINPNDLGIILSAEKRFNHLFDSEQGTPGLEKIQDIADQNIMKYELMKPNSQEK